MEKWNKHTHIDIVVVVVAVVHEIFRIRQCQCAIHSRYVQYILWLSIFFFSAAAAAAATIRSYSALAFFLFYFCFSCIFCFCFACSRFILFFSRCKWRRAVLNDNKLKHRLLERFFLLLFYSTCFFFSHLLHSSLCVCMSHWRTRNVLDKSKETESARTILFSLIKHWKRKFLSFRLFPAISQMITLCHRHRSVPASAARHSAYVYAVRSFWPTYTYKRFFTSGECYLRVKMTVYIFFVSFLFSFSLLFHCVLPNAHNLCSFLFIRVRCIRRQPLYNYTVEKRRTKWWHSSKKKAKKRWKKNHRTISKEICCE